MSAGDMSDGSPVTPELDARMLADLRAWRTRLRHLCQLTLTIDELDMLLRVAAERDALKAAACAEWEAEIPAEIRERAEPTPAYQWRAAGCVWGGDRMGAEAAMRHYARMHGGRLERRVAAGPWTATP